MSQNNLQGQRAVQVSVLKDGQDLINPANAPVMAQISATPTGNPREYSATYQGSGSVQYDTEIKNIKVGDFVVTPFDTTIPAPIIQKIVVDEVANTITFTLDVATIAMVGQVYRNLDLNHGATLYVGGAGNLKIRTIGGDDVTLFGVVAGSFIPIQVSRVFATGTSATNVVAIW